MSIPLDKAQAASPKIGSFRIAQDMREGWRMRSRSVPVEGCTLTLTEEGRGLPLVFVHGAVTTRDLFLDLLGAFSPRVRGIAVDLRGYGDSDKPGWGYNIPQFVSDLIRVADHLGVDRAVWLGVSMGGMVVQRLCLDHPSRVGALVLVSTSDGALAGGLLERNLDGIGRTEDYQILSETIIDGSFPSGVAPALQKRLKERIPTWDAQVLREVLKSIKGFRSREDLYRIFQPTLILVGSEDEQTPPAFAKRLHQAIPESRLVIFEGCGHFMMLEQPDRFREVLAEFLSGLELAA